jgi:WD40 repeat protein
MQRPTPHRGSFLAALAVGFATLLPAAADSPGQDEEVARLVRQLGSRRYAEREAAGRRLQAIGEPAFDALQRAAEGNPDQEVRRRAATLVRAIAKGIYREVARLSGHKDFVFCAAFSPDARHALSAGGGERRGAQWLAGSDFAVRLWDTKAGKEVRRFEGHTATVFDVGFAPDGRHAVSAMRLWEVPSGKEVRRFPAGTPHVWAVAFSPDGRLAASGGLDAAIRLWDVETGREVRRLHGHTQGVVSLAFSPKGDRLLSGGWDKTVRLWEVPAGREVRRLTGHTDRVECVAFAADGVRALSGGLDRAACLWDVRTGELLHRLEGHTDAVLAVDFAADGRSALTGSWDRTVRLWRLPGPTKASAK